MDLLGWICGFFMVFHGFSRFFTIFTIFTIFIPPVKTMNNLGWIWGLAYGSSGWTRWGWIWVFHGANLARPFLGVYGESAGRVKNVR